MLDNVGRVCIVTGSDVYERLRVDFVYKYFKSQGVDVEVHTTDFLHIEKRKRVIQKENYIYYDTKPYKKNMSYARISHHIKLAKDIFEAIKDEEYDLVWCVLPQNSLAREAAKYKLNHPNTKLVFDIMDIWPETMPVNGIKWTAPIKYWKNLRDKNLYAADAVVTECKLFKERLPKDLASKVYPMYLGREATNIESKVNLDDKKINLCYLGSINNIIDIDSIANLVKEIAKINPVCLHIIGDGERKDEFLQKVEATGIEVNYHGLVYDKEEKQQIFDSCNYGLNIMKSSVAIGLTMKSIDYFEYGLPVINNIHGDTWDLINEEKLGQNVEGDYAASIIENAYDIHMRNRCRDFFINNLSDEAITARLEQILSKII